MADYKENDLERARTIVNNLFNKEIKALDIEQNLPIADVENDIEEFTSDLNYFEFAGKVPAMRIGKENSELLPISLRHFLTSKRIGHVGLEFNTYYPFWPEYRYIIRNLLNENIEETDITISPEQAQITFKKLASEFLANRISALSTEKEQSNSGIVSSFLNVFRRKNGPLISTPGCNFSVTTNSVGLRVFWSGGYVVSPKYFSHPTSPATSVLQTGTYIFGVDGGAYGNTIQWDQNALTSLPGTPSIHLNF